MAFRRTADTFPLPSAKVMLSLDPCRIFSLGNGCADMDVKRYASAQFQQSARGPSTAESPFSPQLDADLVSIIRKVEQLYAEGKRTFVIVAHRDPDADAMAGCLGMDRLIRGLLPEDISIRWMYCGVGVSLIGVSSES